MGVKREERREYKNQYQAARGIPSGGSLSSLLSRGVCLVRIGNPSNHILPFNVRSSFWVQMITCPGPAPRPQ